MFLDDWEPSLCFLAWSGDVCGCTIGIGDSCDQIPGQQLTLAHGEQGNRTLLWLEHWALLWLEDWERNAFA